MPSTFLGLNTAYTGLVAAQAALNTTANNIANVSTEGYSRQEISQQAAQALQYFQSYGCVGAGVDTLGAERVRNEFYDAQYRANNSKLGEQDKKAYYCALIESYLEDSDTIEGFTTLFSALNAAMESLATNTGEISYAQTMIGSASNLCQYFNSLYEELQTLQSDINDEIKIEVDQINNIAQQIAALNKQINIIETGTTVTANELRDQRDLLLDELSAIIDIDYEETEVLDANGNATGATNFVLTICGGELLVNGYDYRQLECVARQTWEKENQNDVDGLYDIYWTDTGEELEIYGGTVSGELKGLIELRDGNNGESFSGKVTSVDTLTNSVTIKVTDDYLMDISQSTIPLTDGRIMIGGEYYYYTDYDFTIDEDGNCYYTFNLSDDTSKNTLAINSTAVGQSATIGQSVNYQGIAYYLEQMNEWVRDYAYSFNTLYTADGATNYNGELTNGSIFFTGDKALDGTQYSLDVAVGATSYNSASMTGYFNLTAGNFSVLQELVDDPSTIATHTGETEGDSKYDIIESLLDLSTNKDKMSFRGCSAEDFLICMLTDAALNASNANSFQNIYSNISSSLDNTRLSVSGVDEDEEAANLIKYQNAYSLASKMISVLNECYDKLINDTGV